MKLILADSNELIRIGLRALFSTKSNIQIIGEATSNEELSSMVKSFESDIILIDYTSKGFTIDIIHQLISKKNNLQFVAITPEQSAQTLLNALKSGVRSYVKKDCDSQEIFDSINETYHGNRFFCGQILQTIRNAEIDVNDIDFESINCGPVSLSERETEIITMIAEGLTNGMIAETLNLSTHTVNTHRKNIMAKLGVKNTAGIVMYAVKAHLVSPNKFLFAVDSTISQG